MPTAMDPIEWRGVELRPVNAWCWVSDDRTWRITTYKDAGAWFAYAHVHPLMVLQGVGKTPGDALDMAALELAAHAEKVVRALKQIER
jgi:hypothetical protein